MRWAEPTFARACEEHRPLGAPNVDQPGCAKAASTQTPTADDEPTPAPGEVLAHALPAPTYWPAGLAVGLTSAAFGMITNGIFFYAGLILVVLSIVGWMRVLLAEGSAPQAPTADTPQPQPIEASEPAGEREDDGSYERR